MKAKAMIAGWILLLGVLAGPAPAGGAVVADVGEEKPVSLIHFRTKGWALADTMPFFWKGDYHVFYLTRTRQSRWEHIVSRDLVHWKELPTVLAPDGAPDGPDGGNMFTGSVAEKGGAFYLFYQGQNMNNPKGTENIMIAASPDLVKATKRPELIVVPDGKHYESAPVRDFRDPYVFWNEEEQRYWMLITARRAADREPVVGVATSEDLMRWEQQEPLVFDPPLRVGVPECPDLFKIGDTYYLLFSTYEPVPAEMTNYRYAKSLRGPYLKPASSTIDTSFLYVAKRMWDGRRHILTGWIRDLKGGKDEGGTLWGGTQSIAREVYEVSPGRLGFRPAPEVTAAFGPEILNLKDRPAFHASAAEWRLEGGELTGRAGAGRSQCTFTVPTSYLLNCRVRLDPKAELTISLCEGGDPSSGYRLIIRPGSQEAELLSAKYSFVRYAALDSSRPVLVQAFVLDSIIECFINETYAFSCRAYDWPQGKLGLSVNGGRARVLEMSVRTPREGL
jgi:beta-fructofuranosidase